MAVHIRFLPHPVTNDTIKLYNIHLPSSVADAGVGPGGPTPPPPLLTFWPNWGKMFLETGSPPLPPILGSEWSTSALISRSGSVTAPRVTYYILYHSKTVLNGETYFFLYKIWVPTCSWGSHDSPNDLASPGLRFPVLSCQKIMKPAMFTFLMFRSNTTVNDIIK